jgi:hypothetical protein
MLEDMQEFCTELSAMQNFQAYFVYIPIFFRYSAMDFKEMQQKSTDGEYWTNSSFALVTTLMHSTAMWEESNLIDPPKPFVAMTPFLSERIKAKLQVFSNHCLKKL